MTQETDYGGELLPLLPLQQQEEEEDDDEQEDEQEEEMSGGDLSACVSPSNVVILHIRDTVVYLVGTAHLSKQSESTVRDLVQRVRPFVVMVELCQSRRGILHQQQQQQQQQQYSEGCKNSAERSLSLFTMAKQCFKSSQSIRSAIAKLFLSYFTQRLALRLQIVPGMEFAAAYHTAKTVGSKVILGDRPVEVTLQRLYDSISLDQKFKLLWTLFCSCDDQDLWQILDDDPSLIDRLPHDGDLIKQLVSELGVEFPGIKTVLLDERDRYMADQLRRCIRLTETHFKRHQEQLELEHGHSSGQNQDNSLLTTKESPASVTAPSADGDDDHCKEDEENEQRREEDKVQITKAVVAVVGAAHLQGIAHYLEHPGKMIQVDHVLTKLRREPIRSILAFSSLTVFLVVALINAVLYALRGLGTGGFDESTLDTSDDIPDRHLLKMPATRNSANGGVCGRSASN